MKNRKKLSRKGSKSLFTATAQKTNPVNNMSGPSAGAMRGGIRL